MKRLWAVLIAVAIGGCTSVKMVQRDGCWVRRTEKPFGRVNEDLGPCAAPAASPWADDRLTRLAQECIAREDHRWQSRAVAAWSRGESLPAAGDENVLQACMNEAAKAVVNENEGLRQRLETTEVAARERLESTQERLAEVKGERDAIRTRVDQDLSRALERDEKLAERLLDSNHLLAGHLGEAAKKPSPPAVATATASSDGRARTETLETAETAEAPQPSPVAPVAVVNTVPFVQAAAPADPAQPVAPAAACAPAPTASADAKPSPRARARSRLARAKPACEPVAPIAAAVAAPAVAAPVPLAEAAAPEGAKAAAPDAATKAAEAEQAPAAAAAAR